MTGLKSVDSGDIGDGSNQGSETMSETFGVMTQIVVAILEITVMVLDVREIPSQLLSAWKDGAAVKALRSAPKHRSL